MRHLLQKLFPAGKLVELPVIPKPENLQRELDGRLYAIVRDLKRFKLSPEQIIDELHDAVERVTGETGERLP